MSHHTKFVKIKDQIPKKFKPFNSTFSETLGTTLGAIDIHFHGAFGIDVMSATPQELSELSIQLWKKGVAGFCPTTLSSSPQALLGAVERIGKWIQTKKFAGARPLGIHLEGPFIHPSSCGAHPKTEIRPFHWKELEQLWITSQGTLRILTIAPETLLPSDLKQLIQWSKTHGIHLSLGHSQASELEAGLAFESGFRGVTHTWNALPFHHRNPGVMGAALGRADVYLELIVDQAHVAPTLIQWTLQLHSSRRVCFISDCLAAGGGSGLDEKGRLGSVKIQNKDGACRLPDGQLAGGGLLLTDSYGIWLKSEAERRKVPLSKLFRDTIRCLTGVPLQALRLSRRNFSDRKVLWKLSPTGKIDAIPIDSDRPNG